MKGYVLCLPFKGILDFFLDQEFDKLYLFRKFNCVVECSGTIVEFHKGTDAID